MYRALALSAMGILGVLAAPAPLLASQQDLAGPAGSVAFGSAVKVLPNGNIVVTDPAGPTSGVGAVYVYDPQGALISTFTGSSPNDAVGSDGIVVLPSGNFLVLSSHWHNGSAADAGAVTFVDGTHGLSGVVSATNSLVGSNASDKVGALVGTSGAVTLLSTGKYLVRSPSWNRARGAVTWGSGSAGIAGEVSAANSLVGAAANDYTGYITVALTNGNYVVAAIGWNGGVGAVIGCDGTAGTVGVVAADRAMTGAAVGDRIGSGGLIALANGNYVIASPNWNGGAGAATWQDGTKANVGVVSADNSLVGVAASDGVAASVTALTNGNYVVASNYGGIGAVTWLDGSSAHSGIVAPANSLTGSAAGDRVGLEVHALANGNYVVGSIWQANRGAVTWCDGTRATAATVSEANSLVGSSTNDEVGLSVVPLTNGNYVVGSAFWNGHSGAVTWADGTRGISGAVSETNSIVGAADEQVGDDITPLQNGNYIIASPLWNVSRGAVTWADGRVPTAGTITSDNSLTGDTINDEVGTLVVALNNGDYVVASSGWHANAGALTKLDGRRTFAGVVSSENSVVGSAGDTLGFTVLAFDGGGFAAVSPAWNQNRGAVTVGTGARKLFGQVGSENSVFRSAVAAGGATFVVDYDPARQRWIVGRPDDNRVSVFSPDQIFADNFE